MDFPLLLLCLALSLTVSPRVESFSYGASLFESRGALAIPPLVCEMRRKLPRIQQGLNKLSPRSFEGAGRYLRPELLGIDLAGR